MDARLKKVKKQRDQYKKAYQHCVDDLIVLRANNKRLERDNAEQLALLKQFRKLIDYKLTLHQGSSMYREYRSKLDKLGVKQIKDREKWQKLKDEIREAYIFGYELPKDTPSKYMNEAYGIVFKEMCKLDGTNEFNNLLSDLEDEQDVPRLSCNNYIERREKVFQL